MSGNVTEPLSDIVYMEYIAYNIIVPTVSACGVLGNILNLLVLTRGQMKAPIYIYFTSKSVALVWVFGKFIGEWDRLSAQRSRY